MRGFGGGDGKVGGSITRDQRPEVRGQKMNERRDALLRVPGPAEACPSPGVRSTARALFRTFAAMIAPCSVNA